MTFPTDDVTLSALEAACQIDSSDGSSHPLDFLAFEPGYHQNEVILALIEEIRRLRVSDLEGTQRELDAMTAVAKRLLGKDTVIYPDSDRVARWFSDDRLVTDAEKRALDRLSETREGENDG